MRKFKSNYAVKLLELCRQTPRIMSSNYWAIILQEKEFIRKII